MQPMDAPLIPPPAATRQVPVSGLRQAQRFEAHDCVAEEVPVALEYNGIAHAVMLATPADLADFALGFSFGEGIVDSAAEVLALEVLPCEQGLTVQLRISARRFAVLKERRRTLAGRTGCGLCGVESLPQAVQPVQPLTTTVRFDASAVQKALAALDGHQALRAATGATHAAGWAQADGQLVLVREDVGRHNALDKLLGALLHAGWVAGEGFVVITSRASYEMVSKSARAGVALVAAVSGVTGLAIDVAQQAGVALAGFARGQDLTLYANAHRIHWETLEDIAWGPIP